MEDGFSLLKQGVFGWNFDFYPHPRDLQSTTHKPGLNPLSLTMVAKPTPVVPIFFSTVWLCPKKRQGNATNNLISGHHDSQRMLHLPLFERRLA